MTIESSQSLQNLVVEDLLPAGLEIENARLEGTATHAKRKVALSPKRNGSGAEVNVKDKSGREAGFKRVVVTDARVAPEEPPTREMLNQFLVFQIAARDTGCFPDVQQVKFLQ